MDLIYNIFGDNMKIKLAALISYTLSTVSLLASCIISIINPSKTISELDRALSICFWGFLLLGIAFTIACAMRGKSKLFSFFTKTKALDGVLLFTIVLYAIFSALRLNILSSFAFAAFVYVFELHLIFNLNE